MLIFVKFILGNTMSINVEPWDTIECVKFKIHDEYVDKSYVREKKNETPQEIIENPKMIKGNGIPPEKQRLILGTKTLEDNRTLADYDIQNNTTISLISKLMGGGPIIPMNFIDVEKGVVQNLKFSSYTSMETCK